jgi:hypothetical protein
MTKALHLTGMALILILVALAAALLQPRWARDLGLESPSRTTTMSGRLRPVGDDDWKLRAIKRRIQEKERLAGELIDGRLTLFEAAALFRRLNDAPPKCALPPAPDCPGDSEEERLCRQVIGWAWHRLEKCDPGRANDLAGACEEELRRHKERHGRVVLPDPP